MFRPKEKINQLISNTIRKPAVAGSFYPGEKDQLNSQLDNFLQQAKTVSGAGNLKILIVPHAGIIFSGRTAAWGFKQIEGKDYRRIILLGPSHTAWFDHAAVFNKGTWETPLGKVNIDEDLASQLLDKREKIVSDLNPHWQEHDLEVEVIFLQKVLKNFKIVPVLISNPSNQLIESLANKIKETLDEQTLLVISSDFSHYPDYQTANEVDNQTIAAILSGNKTGFEKKIKELEAKNYPGLETAACGQSAIKVALKVGELLSINWQKIFYENSGDASGDKLRVVGYASLAGYSEKNQKSFLQDSAKKEALQIARKTLKEYLTNKKIPEIKPINQSLTHPLGAFVTLRKQDELRGCIGLFEPEEPLYKVIQKMVIASATEDPRFQSITVNELPEIVIEISVMTPKKKIDDWKKIQLGKHGVVVKQGMRAGTFLPQVAEETGWDREQFLSALCTEKAGLSDNCYKDSQTDIYVFEACVFEENK